MRSIEDYALIGDCQSAALVGKDGSIDWLCLPRFDSGAVFAALLGNSEHGRWLLAPAEDITSTARRYRDNTLILETAFRTRTGEVSLIDFMPPRTEKPELVRIVAGTKGCVRMRSDMVFRFEYGAIVPWVRKEPGGISAVAGPDTIHMISPVPLHGENFHTCAEFEVKAGQRLAFELIWHASHLAQPEAGDPESELKATEQWWSAWVARCNYQGPWREAVVRSLITLKALTYTPTGGMVAAPTTSLPENLGGSRNWDYRYCWLRDSTFTLYAFLSAGYTEEAVAWREWLLRAVAGKPSQIQALYGVAGERRLPELEIPWLPGFGGSRPVRIGNAAHTQLQLDVYGEILDTVYVAHRAGIEPSADAWNLVKALIEHLAEVWHEPDEGIWELRGGRRHLVHSKMMAWVAFDRAIKAAERQQLEGPLDQWRSLRETIHREICERGFDPTISSFVQAYDSPDLDASLLMMPIVGFLPHTEGRMRGTVRAIQERLTTEEGFVYRYRAGTPADAIPEEEGVFLLCTFWLADNLALMGRESEAAEILNDFFPFAMTWVCSRRNTILVPAGCWAISHRRSRTWP